MSDHEQQMAARLVAEFDRLGSDLDRPVAVFAFSAFSAYSLVAALQFTARNPQLSTEQLRVVLGVAHGVAEQLSAAAREAFGPGSAIETTLRQGFDPSHDAPIERGGPS